MRIEGRTFNSNFGGFVGFQATVKNFDHRGQTPRAVSRQRASFRRNGREFAGRPAEDFIYPDWQGGVIQAVWQLNYRIEGTPHHITNRDFAHGHGNVVQNWRFGRQNGEGVLQCPTPVRRPVPRPSYDHQDMEVAVTLSQSSRQVGRNQGVLVSYLHIELGLSSSSTANFGYSRNGVSIGSSTSTSITRGGAVLLRLEIPFRGAGRDNLPPGHVSRGRAVQCQ